MYDEIGEGLPPDAAWSRPGELTDDPAEIEESGLFGHVVVRQFDWEVSCTTEEYIRLLGHFLRPYRDGRVETGPVVQRDPAQAGRAA